MSDLFKAIDQVIDIIKKQKEEQKVDMQAFCSSCIKNITLFNLPFYAVRIDKKDENKINIEVPFLTNCHIKLEATEFGEKEQAAVLYINKQPVRKIKLKEKNNEYMQKIAFALLDYLKKYTVLVNKFKEE